MSTRVASATCTSRRARRVDGTVTWACLATTSTEDLGELEGRLLRGEESDGGRGR